MEYNFGAGPAMVAPEVLALLVEAEKAFPGTTKPLSSINHRDEKFEAMVDDTIALVKKLLDVPAGYSVLFVPGGATTQFTAWALNIVHNGKFRPMAGYVDSGHWGHEAYQLSERLYSGGVCGIRKIASTAKQNYRVYPRFEIGAQRLDYLHVVTNETVNGTQMQNLSGIPKRDGLVVVADMTSEIMSRPIPFDRFGIVYAGTQKQFGLSGTLVLIIVRDDLVQAGHPLLPEPLSYKEQIKEKGGLRNTVSTGPLYSVYLTLQWIEAHGGIQAMQQRAEMRASQLYRILDESGSFYLGVAEHESRSKMNVTFQLRDTNLHTAFLAYCEKAGLVGLNGHIGAHAYLGPYIRASLYNVMPFSGVHRLIGVMHEFKKLHG